jgi:hypothetical protein
MKIKRGGKGRGKRRGMEGEERRVEGKRKKGGGREGGGGEEGRGREEWRRKEGERVGRGGEEGSMTKQKLDLQCSDIGDLDSI